MKITLELEQQNPPVGRARLAPHPGRPAHGAGASGVAASVRFVGWLGLIKGLTQLIKAGGALLLVLAIAAPRAASATPASVVVSTKAFVPLAVITEGTAGLYLNADSGEHTVTSDGVDHVMGERLFWTDVAGAGEALEIHGIERVAPGTYGFFCSYHTTMRGTLVVLDA